MNIFSIYVACTILPIALFLIGLMVAVVIQARRGPTADSRAFARELLCVLLSGVGFFLAEQNLFALMNPSTRDTLSPGMHIGVIVVGVAVMVGGLVLRERVRPKAQG